MNFTKILIFIFVLFSVSLNAQEVSNVHFEQVGKQINIFYDLEGDQDYTVQVFCSTNAGLTWGTPLQKVNGAVGESQEEGNNKEIIWDVLVEREQLEGKIQFMIIVSPNNKGTFTDPRDGQTYSWVKIGDQVWMAENLNIGFRIEVHEPQINNKIIEKYCYDNVEANCSVYGGLYQWDEMMQYYTKEGIKGICPYGWHLPTDTEWKKLELSIGMSQTEVDNEFPNSRGNSGSKLKSNHGWHENGNGSDIFGFKALPGGYRSIKYGGKFDFLEWSVYWWTSSEACVSPSGAWTRSLNCFNNELDRNYHGYYGANEEGKSVRCLKDIINSKL